MSPYGAVAIVLQAVAIVLLLVMLRRGRDANERRWKAQRDINKADADLWVTQGQLNRAQQDSLMAVVRYLNREHRASLLIDFPDPPAASERLN